MYKTNRYAVACATVLMFIFSGLYGAPAMADVRLPHVFSSHMVLQQEKPITIWGWAQPNEAVTVQLLAEKQETKANERGEWKTVLPAEKAGGPYTLAISGANTVKFEDVLVGEVWLCSGQSNMEMGMHMINNAQKEIAAADHPEIRLLLVTRKWAAQPQQDIDGTWKLCSPKSVSEGGWNGFSAAAYFFGRELHQKLNVPIGLIESSWGGTRIESWTPPEGFAAIPAFKHESDLMALGDPRNPAYQASVAQTLDATQHWMDNAKKALAEHAAVPPMPTWSPQYHGPNDLQQSTALYNGQIHPLVPFAIRGAIWYQGESNMGEGMLYAERMKALIGGWRQIWGEGDFPFYFVQIAPFRYGQPPQVEAEIWEAQTTAAQVIPNTGMAVINDIGQLGDIHPKNKQEVGRRLALWALANTYGQEKLVHSGPTFKSLAVENDKLRLTFDNIGGGLASRDGKPLDWFEVCDADNDTFVKAQAEIDGATVVVHSPEAPHPIAVRYAWSMLAEPNLMNTEKLPAGSFRAAAPVPPAERNLLETKVPESKDYELVYDLDLSKLGHDITYDVDNHARIQKPFDRIAYFMELQGTNGATHYVYVSMDAFTNDLGKIGVPTVASQAHFQQNVSKLNVISNVKGIITGTGLDGGNIEFWPNNYAPANSAKVPNADDKKYDFGNQPVDPVDGYGSMQVHNYNAKQTLFSLNNWNNGGNADIGIGNSLSGEPDWTFAKNAGSYRAKRLRILVHLK